MKKETLNNMKGLVAISLLALLYACGGDNTQDVGTTDAQPPAEEILVPHLEVKKADFYVNKITNDSAWYWKVEEKSAQQGVPVDEMIQRDANFLARQDAEVVKIANDIIDNKTWLEAVNQKAESQGRPLEEMIRADAYYMFTQKQKQQ